MPRLTQEQKDQQAILKATIKLAKQDASKKKKSIQSCITLHVTDCDFNNELKERKTL